jgi:hypothetical protein
MEKFGKTLVQNTPNNLAAIRFKTGIKKLGKEATAQRGKANSRRWEV